MSKWAIVQYDNRPLTDNFRSLQERNMAYCKKHQYEYIFSNDPYDLPPYWVKVKLVREVLERDDIKGVLWLDIDAVVHHMSIPLDMLLIDKKSFYYTPDPTLADFNAGIWMVLQTPMGKEIMDAWMTLYTPSTWSYNGHEWKTEGVWGGPTYEQGSFIDVILPKYKKYLCKYPWQLFQNYDYKVPPVFISHFFMNRKLEIPDYLQTLPALSNT